jgi:hypothetical protein
MPSTASGFAGVTVLRTLVRIRFAAQSLVDQFNVGLIVGRRRDISSTTQPNPVDISATHDAQLDWAWQDTYYMSSSGATFDSNLLVNIDTKVRRRIRDNSETWMLVMQNPAGSARTWDFNVRTLVALP